METIVIQSKSKSNASLIMEIVKKIGDKAKLLTEEQTEDISLGLLMKSVKTRLFRILGEQRRWIIRKKCLDRNFGLANTHAIAKIRKSYES